MCWSRPKKAIGALVVPNAEELCCLCERKWGIHGKNINFWINDDKVNALYKSENAIKLFLLKLALEPLKK